MAQAKMDFIINTKVDRTAFSDLKREIQSLQSLTEKDLIKLGSASDLSSAKTQLTQIQDSAKQVEAALNKAFSAKLGTVSLSKFNNELKGLNLQKIAADFNKAGVQGQIAFNNLTASVLTTKTHVKEANKWLNDMSKTMSNTIKWGISSGAWNTFTGSFQQAYGYVKNLDTSLNNIRIVSEKSADEMARFANQANKAAKSLGATTLDYTNASLIYYQQGLNEEQVANRTNTTVKLANTLGVSAQEVSDYMTAIWNNFDDGSKSIEYYADVLTKLGAATASSAEEISTGLEKFAAISKTVGLSYEYATAALTTVTAETRQSAEVVGTAFKTLFARIQDLELGKTLEDGVTLGKYSEALKTIGISIVSSNGEMKKMDDILDELGKKWQTLTEAQKVSLAQTVAGTRQYTQLVALMDNWDDFSQNLNMAKNATGELNKQQAIYMESTEAHLDQLSAETERLYKNLIDSDGLNALIDAFSGLVAGVNQYTEAIGGSGSVLAQLGSIALRVMNKDLSKGITTSISNLIGLRDKTKEVNAQLELMQMFKGIPMNNGAYNQLLKMVDGLQKYRSVLTDTQIEEANAAIMRRNELANDLQAWDNAREKAELYFNVMTGENLDLSKSINSEEREKALTSIDNFLVKYSQKTGQIKGLLDETFKSGQASTDKEQRDIFIRRAEKLIQRNMLKNPETEKALKDGLNDYKKFVEQYPAVTQDILDRSGKVIGQYEFFDDNQEAVIEDFKKAYADAVDEIIKDSGEVKTAIETSYAGLGTGISNAVEEADSSWTNLENRFKAQVVVSSFVNMTSAAMQLGNAIASIGNIDDIWFDDDLSDGEKTLQILLAIGNAIGGVAQVAGNVKNTMGLLRTAFGKTSVSGGVLAGAMEYMEHQTKQVTEKQGAYIAQQNIYQKESAESAMSQVQELGYVEALAKAYRVLSAAMAENNLIRKEAPTGLIFSQGDLTAIQEDIDMLFDESLSKRIKSAMKKVEKIGQEPTNEKALKASTVKDLAKKGIKDPKFKGNKNQLSFMDQLDNAIDKDESKTSKKLLTQETVKDTTKGLSEVAEAAKKTGEALGDDKSGAAVGAGLKGAIKGVGSLLAKVPGWGWVATGALVALTAAVYLGVKAWNADANAAKEAAKEAQEAQATYEELKEKANKLKESISNYTEAIEAMKDLTEGTEEFKTALEEANEKAIELLETYNLFGKYTIKDGVITIDEDALKELQNAANMKVNDAENSSYMAKIIANEKQDISKTTNLGRRIGSVVGDGTQQVATRGQQEEKRKFTNDELIATAKAMNKLRESSEAEYKTAISSDKAFKEMLLTLDGVPQAVLDNIDAYVENRKAIVEHTQGLYDSEKANRFYTEQMYTNLVENKYGEKINQMVTDKDGNVDTTRAAQISNIVTKTDDKAVDKMNNDLNNADDKLKDKKYKSNNALKNNYGYDIENDKDLVKTYLKEIKGYTQEELDTFTFDDKWGKATVTDDQGNNILLDKNDKEMRKALALKKIRGDIETEYTNNLDAEKQLNAIGKLTTVTDSKLGKGFSDAILNALTTDNKKMDFSGVYAELSPEEAVEWQEAALTDDGKTDSAGLLKKLGIDEATIKAAGFESADQFAQQFAVGLSEYKWDKESALKAAMGAQSDEIEKHELDSEAVEEYADHLMDIAKESGEVDDGLETNAKSAAKIATVLSRANKGLGNLSEGFEDWSKMLKTADKESQEYSEALNDMKDSLADVFGVDSGDIDSDFVTENLDLIGRAAQGSEEALVELQKKLSEDLIMDIAVDNTLGDQAKTQVMGLHNDIQNMLSGFKIGDINDTDFAAACENIIKSANMTAEQAQAYFNSMGMSVKFKTKPETVKTKKPKVETTRRITDWDQYNNPTKWEESSKVTGYDEVEEVIQVPAFSTNGDEPVIESITYSGSPKNLNNQTAKKNSSSGSKKDPKKEDKVEDEKDRYHDINIELKQIENELKKVQDEQDNLVGSDLIANLQRQYNLLNKEIDATARKIGIAKGEQDELQAKLAGYGVNFNEDGTIANYAAAWDAQLAYVNGIIDKYNAMDANAQEKYQETLDNAKEQWNKFKENVERYDALVTEDIPGLEADIRDALDQQIEIKLEAFEYEIQIRLDMSEAMRDWNEFKAKIIDGIKEDDILGNAKAKLANFHSYYNADGTGEIQATTKHVDNIMAQLKQMDADQAAGVYGETYTYTNAQGKEVTVDYNNRKQALEDLKEYYSQLMDSMMSLQELQEEIHQSYLDMMDEAQEKFDEQLSTYQTIDEIIQHDMNLVQLMYGDSASLAKYYKEQRKNLDNQLDFQKQQVAFWRNQMDTLEQGSEEWEKAKENWIAAGNEWRSLAETNLQVITDEYTDAINTIFENLNNSVTNGMGLSYVSKEWELINQNADRYLDQVNAIYETQTLQNKYLDAIEQSTNPAQQKKLNDLMQEEINLLKEKDKLSQYDLDRANLKYEIAMKQMALEESQQKKTQLRLRRDSQGNYSYQYTNDESEVSKLQQELSDLYNQLYNLDAGQYKSNLDELYSVWDAFQQDMYEASLINDPEERKKREEMLEREYGELINGIVADNESIKQNLQQSTMSQLLDLYDQNEENYNQMTESQRAILDNFISEEASYTGAAFDNLFGLYNENLVAFDNMTNDQIDMLMNDFIPQWNSGVQQMADTIIGEGGFAQVTKSAIEEIRALALVWDEERTAAYNEAIAASAELQKQTEELAKDNTTLIETYGKELEAVRDVIKELETLIATYGSAEEAAKKAAQAAYEYWQAANNENAKTDTNIKTDQDKKNTGGPKADVKKENTNTQTNSLGYASNGAPFIATYTVRSGDTLSGIASRYGINWNRIYAENRGVIGGNPNLIQPGQTYKIPKYATGGYTGDWAGNGGQLAMLHKKELVLNSSDTKNILNAVEILRSITSALGHTLMNQMSTISAGNTSSIANAIGTDTLEQMVHIDAQFPNVRDSQEIENALNNLVNVASQHIQK